MIAPEAGLSMSRQCALLGVARSSFYYRPRPESVAELEVRIHLPPAGSQQRTILRGIPAVIRRRARPGRGPNRYDLYGAALGL